ncbi:MAG TPA: chloride channel protein [Bacteroidia bacterium]|jgi:CIC family chloride channel protein|nr:chloride channel protein [Bacteroidia bacterium]
MKFIRFYEYIINWLHSKLTKRQFLIFASILVGLSAGLAAVILKSLVHYIHYSITTDHHFPYQYYYYLAFPVIGLVLTTFIVQRFFKGKQGRGPANIIHSILRKSAILPKDQMYSQVLTSAITVGFGGSAGLESPMVTTGSAIGSNFGRTYHLHYKDRVLLLASGAAAGIAAAFDSPIAGVLFALEVLLTDVSITVFIPLIMAAATGALCSHIILQEGILLSFPKQQPFNSGNIPFYMILGILAGLVSVYYTRTYVKIEEFFKQRKGKPYQNALLGGIILSCLIMLFPTLFSEGYSGINSLAEGRPEDIIRNSALQGISSDPWFILIFIGLVMIVKVVATSVTINSGGNGGNFAPSLFTGAYLGYFFSRMINLTGLAKLPESNFTLVAMSGILSGIMHAPLTGIFLIAEITGGYNLMIPLMLVSATSFLIMKYFEPYSMEAKKLAKKGHVLTHDKDKSILSSLKAGTMIETGFHEVGPDTKLRELVDVVAHSSRNLFPVVNVNKELLGVITLDNIREIMFKTELYDSVFARDLMRMSPATLTPSESMHSVMKKFDETGAWNLPVILDGSYLGFISKTSVFTNYRQILKKSSLR